jgi:hypothetical protein
MGLHVIRHNLAGNLILDTPEASIYNSTIVGQQLLVPYVDGGARNIETVVPYTSWSSNLPVSMIEFHPNRPAVLEQSGLPRYKLKLYE